MKPNLIALKASILAVCMAACLVGGYCYRDKTAKETAAQVKIEVLKETIKPLKKRIKTSKPSTDSTLSRAEKLADSALAAAQSPAIVLAPGRTSPLPVTDTASVALPSLCKQAVQVCRQEIATRDTIIAKQDSTIVELEKGPSKGSRVKSFVKTVVAWEAMKKYGPRTVKFLVKAVVR